MPNVCKGICTNEEYTVRYNPYYGLGDRWCRECRVAFMGFEPSISRCPCCGTPLRTNCDRNYRKKEYSTRKLLTLAGKLHEHTKCSICGSSNTTIHRHRGYRYPSWRKLFGKYTCEHCFQKYYRRSKEPDLLAALRRKEAKHKKELLVCQNLIAAYLKQSEPMPVYCRA